MKLKTQAWATTRICLFYLFWKSWFFRISANLGFRSLVLLKNSTKFSPPSFLMYSSICKGQFSFFSWIYYQFIFREKPSSLNCHSSPQSQNPEKSQVGCSVCSNCGLEPISQAAPILQLNKGSTTTFTCFSLPWMRDLQVSRHLLSGEQMTSSILVKSKRCQRAQWQVSGTIISESIRAGEYLTSLNSSVFLNDLPPYLSFHQSLTRLCWLGACRKNSNQQLAIIFQAAQSIVRYTQQNGLFWDYKDYWKGWCSKMKNLLAIIGKATLLHSK